MNKVRVQSLLIMMLLMVTAIPSASLLAIPEGNQKPSASSASLDGMAKDLLIIHDPTKYAFFGWYRPTDFSTTILDLLNRTILWASSQSLPNETRIVFYGDSNNTYAVFVHDWLVGGGYLTENILNQTSANIEEFSPSYYDDIDLVIYWNTFAYDPTNVIDAGVPFITVSALQTDEMGIGSGVVTDSSLNETFYIVNNGYYPTESYPLGSVFFDDSYRYETTEASPIGRVLVKAQVPTEITKIEMSTIENVTINGDGSADINFTITIPESPLAEALREAFFSDTSSLQENVQYDVPQNKTISYTSAPEQAIKDVTLLGDVTGDGQVDMSDLELISDHVDNAIGDSGFNSSLDLNWDGRIDMKDVAIAARNHGKTISNTGSLNVGGYYNGELVNCTDVFYTGPEESLPINMSAVGYVWYCLLPGEYKINGTYNSLKRSTNITVVAGKVAYAQLDFGGIAPPAAQSEVEPVREGYHQGIVMEQLILLGFDMNITDSKIVPYSTSNITTITLTASSSHLSDLIGPPNWQIRVGPTTDNLTSIAAEFIFTKIQYMMLLLQSIPGDQIYKTSWQIGFELPAGSTLLDEGVLDALEWTIDFGEGTFMQANVSVSSGRVIVNETMVVTEHNITATEAYLISALGNYRKFAINYTYSGTPPAAAKTTPKL
ncbi:MAG: dockerin type I domain-containing protein, partial [Candidatus Thorarchaeota archaeon]